MFLKYLSAILAAIFGVIILLAALMTNDDIPNKVLVFLTIGCLSCIINGIWTIADLIDEES
jgi:predicted membrane protein